MSDLTVSPFHALQNLLEHSYDDGELRILAWWAFRDAEIARSLPGAGASVRDLAFHVVETANRVYSKLPPSFWQYLHTTRPGRRAEIVQLQLACGDDSCLPIAPPELTRCETIVTPTPALTPTDELHSVLRLTTRLGTCDLLRCPRPFTTTPGDPARNPFVYLQPGMVNGMDRQLVLETTAQGLALCAIPSLYRDGERLPSRIELPGPLADETFSYYPLGRNGYPGSALTPTMYRLSVARWDRCARSITLTADSGARWRVDLQRPPGE